MAGFLPGWGTVRGKRLLPTRGLLSPQSAITKVTAAHDRQLLWKANVGFVIKLQARLRGFLVRQKFAESSRIFRTLLPAVIKIQVATLAFPRAWRDQNYWVSSLPPSLAPGGVWMLLRPLGNSDASCALWSQTTVA